MLCIAPLRPRCDFLPSWCHSCVLFHAGFVVSLFCLSRVLQAMPVENRSCAEAAGVSLCPQFLCHEVRLLLSARVCPPPSPSSSPLPPDIRRMLGPLWKTRPQSKRPEV